MPLAIFLLLLGISAIVGIGVIAWCIRLARIHQWKQVLAILAAGMLGGLLLLALAALLLMILGEKPTAAPAAFVGSIFGVAFVWGSFAMAITLGLWPYVKLLVLQSRRWADRRSSV